VINKLAAQKIIQKYRKYFLKHDDLPEMEALLKEFDVIIDFEDEFRNKIIDFYAEQFFSGDTKLAMKELERKSGHNNNNKSIIVYLLIELVIFLLISLLLLIFLSGK